MATTDEYADILAMVMENGRVNFEQDREGAEAELEVEIEFEAGERGLNEEEIAEAVEYARTHIRGW